MTPSQAIGHYEYACRATVVICIAFVAGLMIGLIRDEVEA